MQECDPASSSLLSFIFNSSLFYFTLRKPEELFYHHNLQLRIVFVAVPRHLPAFPSCVSLRCRSLSVLPCLWLYGSLCLVSDFVVALTQTLNGRELEKSRPCRGSLSHWRWPSCLVISALSSVSFPCSGLSRPTLM